MKPFAVLLVGQGSIYRTTGSPRKQNLIALVVDPATRWKGYAPGGGFFQQKSSLLKDRAWPSVVPGNTPLLIKERSSSYDCKLGNRGAFVGQPPPPARAGTGRPLPAFARASGGSGCR